MIKRNRTILFFVVIFLCLAILVCIFSRLSTRFREGSALAKALEDFRENERISADANVSIKSGMLQGNENFVIDRWLIDDMQIHALDNGAVTLYIADGKTLLDDGSILHEDDSDDASIVELLNVAHDLYTHSSTECVRNEDSYVYTVIPDSEALAIILDCVAPEEIREKLEASSGYIKAWVRENKFEKIEFGISGTVSVLLYSSNAEVLVDFVFTNPNPDIMPPNEVLLAIDK